MVMAVWLFNYADSTTSLRNMMTTVVRNLAPSGRLVAITVHPAFDPDGQGWDTYGLRTDSYTALPDRRRLTSSLLTPEDAIPIEYSQWSATAYARAAHDVGLSDLRWTAPGIPEKDLLKHDSGFWDTFQTNPFIAGLTATAYREASS